MFQLKNYVLEIYRTGSFSQAAANLYVSQPSLSASIKRLEDRIGEPLFDRSTHPIRLTECGQAYVRTARTIITAEDNFSSFLEDYGNCQTGTLALGGSNLNLSYVLPSVLQKFQAAYPKIQLQILEGNIDDLKQLLLEGKLDFVVDSCEVDPQRFNEFIYQPETLILSVPTSFECNRRLAPFHLTREDILQNRHLEEHTPCVPLKDLTDVPFVFPTPETDTYKRSWHICQRAGFTPLATLSFHQQATVFHINCAGIGAAFISDILVKNTYSHPELIYYKIGGSESFRHIKFFKKREKQMTRAMQAFLAVARE